MRATTMFFKVLSCLALCCLLVGCGPSAVRKYAGILAADTEKLNEQFESLTKARDEIDSSREDLSKSLQLAILQAEDYTARRLDVWRSLKATSVEYGRRLAIYGSVLSASEAALGREDSMRSISTKLDTIRNESKSKKSDELGEAAKSLAALSKDISIDDSISLLAGFARSVRSDLKKVEEDSANASASAVERSDAIKGGEFDKDLKKLTPK
jgi:hypothetical protein